MTIVGVLCPAVRLKDGAIGAIGALTVTRTAAEIVGVEVAFPDPCGVGFVVPGY